MTFTQLCETACLPINTGPVKKHATIRIFTDFFPFRTLIMRIEGKAFFVVIFHQDHPRFRPIIANLKIFSQSSASKSSHINLSRGMETTYSWKADGIHFHEWYVLPGCYIFEPYVKNFEWIFRRQIFFQQERFFFIIVRFSPVWNYSNLVSICLHSLYRAGIIKIVPNYCTSLSLK